MTLKLFLITPFEPDIKKIISKIKDHQGSSQILNPSLLNSLEKTLGGLIQDIIQIAIIEELQAKKSQGLLVGTTGADKFNSFIKDLSRKKSKQAFLTKYPVIRELITKQRNIFFDQSYSLLKRLQNDWHEIESFFFPNDSLIEVHEIKFLSEPHGNGNRTCLIKFMSKNKNIVECIYKPRSSKIDLHIQDIFLWIQEHTNIHFLAPKLIDKHDYSWSEFIKQSDGITEASKINRFYERLGGLLAITYACRGRDLHCENIIACGEHPVLVDYECFLVPNVLDDKESVFESTVYDCMILTNFSFLFHKLGGLDLSSLSGYGGQMSPSRQFIIANNYTDDITFEYVNQIIEPTGNIPKYRGKPVTPHKYKEKFLEGFVAIYNFLIDHKEDLLTKIQAFQNSKIRIVPRSTMTYDQILQLTKKPIYTLSKKSHNNFIEGTLKKVTQNRVQKLILKNEVREIKNLDIPYFYTYANLGELYDSSGKLIKGVSFPSGIEATLQHVKLNLNGNNLKKQICIINNSFDSLCHREKIPLEPTKTGIKSQNNPLPSLIQQLDEIADISLQTNSNITWPTIVHRAHPKGEITNACFTSKDFYDGKVGVGLLFLYASVLINQKYWDIAIKCFDNCVFYESNNNTPLGFYGGVGGILYALEKYSELLSSSKYNHLMIKILESVYLQIGTEDNADISYGTSGYLLSLLTIKSPVSKKPIFTSSLEKCIDHLTSKPLKSYDSAGFAHGMAGIVYTLSRAYTVTNNAKAKEWLTINASTYMNALQKSDLSQLKWCNGTLGICLAGHQAHSSLICSSQNSYNISSLYPKIISTLDDHTGMQNFSLCHGLMGVLDCLMVAKDKELMSESIYREESKKILSRIGSGEDLSYERGSIGIMTGKAGIAYQLLRLQYPDKVPSILFP